jgi:hypothetical protein
MHAAALRQAASPGTIGSVGLHVTLALLLFLAVGVQMTRPPAVEAIEVEIVPPGAAPAQPQAQAVRRPESVPGALAPGAASPQATPPVRRPATPQPMIQATTMLAERVLADPRSRQARVALTQMTDDERMVQLCSVEAMSQIHAWRRDFRPDRVVDGAMSASKVQDHTVTAGGAAFRSQKLWYGLAFDCEVAADLRKIVSFAFRVGEPIPREDWEDLNLPPVY